MQAGAAHGPCPIKKNQQEKAHNASKLHITISIRTKLAFLDGCSLPAPEYPSNWLGLGLEK